MVGGGVGEDYAELTLETDWSLKQYHCLSAKDLYNRPHNQTHEGEYNTDLEFIIFNYTVVTHDFNVTVK